MPSERARKAAEAVLEQRKLTGKYAAERFSVSRSVLCPINGWLFDGPLGTDAIADLIDRAAGIVELEAKAALHEYNVANAARLQARVEESERERNSWRAKWLARDGSQYAANVVDERDALRQRLDAVIAAILELEGTQGWGPGIERVLRLARGEPESAA